MSAHRFDIQPHEWPLIEAAIDFGDQLAVQPEATDEQREAIRRVQDALHHLPEVTWNLSGCFGFEVAEEALHKWCDTPGGADSAARCPQGTFQGWEIDYARGRRADGRHNVVIEIWNYYWPYPEKLHEEFAGEEYALDLLIISDEPRVAYDELTLKHQQWLTERIEAWVHAVRDPSQFRHQGRRFELEAMLWTPAWLRDEGQAAND